MIYNKGRRKLKYWNFGFMVKFKFENFRKFNISHIHYGTFNKRPRRLRLIFAHTNMHTLIHTGTC